MRQKIQAFESSTSITSECVCIELLFYRYWSIIVASIIVDWRLVIVVSIESLLHKM